MFFDNIIELEVCIIDVINGFKLNYDQNKILVSFKYSDDKLKLIKSVPSRRWNPLDRVWEIDYNYKNDLIDLISSYGNDENIVRIKLTPTTGYLIGVVPDECIDEIYKKCSYIHPNIYYIQKNTNSRWDGTISLFNKKTRSFPVGLIDVIKKILNYFKIKYKIITEERRIKKCKFPIENDITLRDYQVDAVKEAIDREKCIIPLPVGSGKTMCAIAIACYYNKKTIFLTPTKEIMYQTAQSFKEHCKSVDVGIIGDGIVDIKQITVATYQAISSALKRNKRDVLDYLQQVEVLIADECHHVSSDTFYKIAMAIPAEVRIGLTATPFRTDNSEIKFIAAIGECIKCPTTLDLVDDGYLVPADIRMIKLPSKPPVIYYRDEYEEVYKKYIINNEIRNKAIAKIASDMIKKNRKVLILVSRIVHGEILEKMIKKSKFIYSASDDRKEVYEKMRVGKRECTIATQIFDEGVDLLAVDCIIIAGGGKSPIKTIQRIGRGLRKFKHKKETIIIDFIDNTKYLRNHSLERKKTYMSVFGNAKIINLNGIM